MLAASLLLAAICGALASLLVRQRRQIRCLRRAYVDLAGWASLHIANTAERHPGSPGDQASDMDGNGHAALGCRIRSQLEALGQVGLHELGRSDMDLPEERAQKQFSRSTGTTPISSRASTSLPMRSMGLAAFYPTRLRRSAEPCARGHGEARCMTS